MQRLDKLVARSSGDIVVWADFELFVFPSVDDLSNVPTEKVFAKMILVQCNMELLDHLRGIEAENPLCSPAWWPSLTIWPQHTSGANLSLAELPFASATSKGLLARSTRGFAVRAWSARCCWLPVCRGCLSAEDLHTVLRLRCCSTSSWDSLCLKAVVFSFRWFPRCLVLLPGKMLNPLVGVELNLVYVFSARELRVSKGFTPPYSKQITSLDCLKNYF